MAIPHDLAVFINGKLSEKLESIIKENQRLEDLLDEKDLKGFHLLDRMDSLEHIIQCMQAGYTLKDYLPNDEYLIYLAVINKSNL